MIKEIAGVAVTGFVMVYLFWFVIPITKTAYNVELSQLNTTSSLMQTILPFTNNWWVVFPLLIAIIGGYTIYNYLTNREAFDY